MTTKKVGIHVWLTTELKAKIKKSAKQHGMSMTAYMIHCYHTNQNQPITTPKFTKRTNIDIPIERIKQEKNISRSHIPTHIDSEMRNSIKNLFATKTVKDILKNEED